MADAPTLKFRYNDKGQVEFFVIYKGATVIVLTAELEAVDFQEFLRLQALALDEFRILLPILESNL